MAVVGSLVLILANVGKISAGGIPSTLAYVLKHPKNLSLTLAAALTIAQANVSVAGPWIALAVFVIIASPFGLIWLFLGAQEAGSSS